MGHNYTGQRHYARSEAPPCDMDLTRVAPSSDGLVDMGVAMWVAIGVDVVIRKYADMDTFNVCRLINGDIYYYQGRYLLLLTEIFIINGDIYGRVCSHKYRYV